MRAAFLLGVLVAAGCGPTSTTEQQAIEAADGYRKSHGFYREGESRLVSVRNEGRQLVVTYHVPKGAVGGEFVVFVDKRTMRAVGHEMWQ